MYFWNGLKPQAKSLLLKSIIRTGCKHSVASVLLHLAGPNHIKVYIMPRPGVDLIRWSVGSDPEPVATTPPPGATGDDYFIYYSYGIKPEHPWQFWLDLQVMCCAAYC